MSTLVSINLAHPEGWNALQQIQTWCHWLIVTLSSWTCWRIPLSCWTCFSNLANLCAVEHYRLLLFAAGLVEMLCWSNSMCQSWSSIDFLSQSTMQQSVLGCHQRSLKLCTQCTNLLQKSTLDLDNHSSYITFFRDPFEHCGPKIQFLPKRYHCYIHLNIEANSKDFSKDFSASLILKGLKIFQILQLIK